MALQARGWQRNFVKCHPLRIETYFDEKSISIAIFSQRRHVVPMGLWDPFWGCFFYKHFVPNRTSDILIISIYYNSNGSTSHRIVSL
jgi:hypothetical protein